MAIELITPKPLSPFIAIAAAAPIVIVGIAIHFQNWRRSRLRPMSNSQVLTNAD
jgi:hypothetical protein